MKHSPFSDKKTIEKKKKENYWVADASFFNSYDQKKKKSTMA